MAAMTLEEFYKRYNEPKVQKVTVGFSGIDPSPIGFSSDPSSLSEEQIEIIRKLILVCIAQQPIRIDSGNIAPNADEPEAPVEVNVTVKPSEISHEVLDKLLGGKSGEHYHLTNEEYSKLAHLLSKAYPNQNSDEPVFVDTTTLTELIKQQVISEEGKLPHLTAEEYSQLLLLLDKVYPEDDEPPAVLDNYELIQLINQQITNSGENNYYLTDREYQRLLRIFTAVYPTKDTIDPVFVNEENLNNVIETQVQQQVRQQVEEVQADVVNGHENLNGLLGGNEGGHYHLTFEEHTRMSQYPDVDEVGNLIPHNDLKLLQGGDENEYYHLSKAEYLRLLGIVEAFYPPNDDSDDNEDSEGSNSVMHVLSDNDYRRLQQILAKMYPNEDAAEPDFMTKSQIEALISERLQQEISYLIDCGEITVTDHSGEEDNSDVTDGTDGAGETGGADNTDNEDNTDNTGNTDNP